MTKVLPVNLPYNIKTLWFDPGDLDVKAADDVVVQTARGLELGCAASDIIEVDYEQIKKLKSPLKPVERIATSEDIAKAKEMERLSREAMPYFREMARETSEDMHPVSVEYLLDGDKAVFYFEAEERIDFRDLVRKLAAHFHIRIDMRQIGVRDEARIIGGLGHCGQVICCKRLGGEFNPVSIRMAKDQDLSLNPQKISGLCGRLMCCLRYESEAYKDFKSRAPKIGATVNTPEGQAKVEGLDALLETVTLRTDREKPIKVPISCFETPEEGARPNTVIPECWDDVMREEELEISTGSSIFSTSQFTGTDKLGSGLVIHNETSSSRASDPLAGSVSKRHQHSEFAQESSIDESEGTRRSRRRSTKIKGGKAERVESANDNEKPSQGHVHDDLKRTHQKPRRRKSHTLNQSANQSDKNKNVRVVSKGNGGNSGNSGNDRRSASGIKQGTMRPGHKSSGLAHDNNSNDASNTNRNNQHRRFRKSRSKTQGSDHNRQGDNSRDQGNHSTSEA